MPGSLRNAAAGRLKAYLPALLIVFGLGRIIATYPVFVQTYDEPAHVSCGMEWLVDGAYKLEAQHPPLARVMLALGPYLQARFEHRNPFPHTPDPLHPESAPKAEMWGDGNLIFHGGEYDLTLSLSRMGILPFYLLGCWVVWSWANWAAGKDAALAALFLFTTLPVILANGAISTTDMAASACGAGVLYSFARWIGQTTTRRSLALGLFLGAAVMTKFSNLIFLPIGAGAVLLCGFIGQPRPSFSRRNLGRFAKAASLAAATACLLIWSCYRFSMESIVKQESRPHSIVAKVFGSSPVLTEIANRVLEAPIPAPELFRGLVWVYGHNKGGHEAYLLGGFRMDGWWYFFPVAILVKTPIAFLLLVLAGIYFLFRPAGPGRGEVGAALLAAAGIVAVCMLTTINLGVRHILIVYPLLSVVAGTAAISLWRQAGRLAPAAAIVLLSWQLLASTLAHPYYLAYFNEFARRQPEAVLAGSDLDWGQDLGILSRRLAELHIKDVSLLYYGSADTSAHGMPRVHPLPPLRPVDGWVAVSISALKLDAHKRDMPGHAFEWLSAYQPMEKVGTSFLLYKIPDKAGK